MSFDNSMPRIFLTEPIPAVYKYPTGTLPPWIIKVAPGNYRIDIGNAPEIPIKLCECQEIMEALNSPGEHFHMDVVDTPPLPPETMKFEYYLVDQQGNRFRLLRENLIQTWDGRLRGAVGRAVDSIKKELEDKP